MSKDFSNCIVIGYGIQLKFEKAGISVENCDETGQLKNVINNNKRYQIIMVFKAEHGEELRDIISQRYIHEILILGSCPELKILNKKVKEVEDMQQLNSYILKSVATYTNREQLQDENRCNGVANLLSQELKKLHDEMEDL